MVLHKPDACIHTILGPTLSDAKAHRTAFLSSISSAILLFFIAVRSFRSISFLYALYQRNTGNIGFPPEFRDLRNPVVIDQASLQDDLSLLICQLSQGERKFF